MILNNQDLGHRHTSCLFQTLGTNGSAHLTGKAPPIEFGLLDNLKDMTIQDLAILRGNYLGGEDKDRDLRCLGRLFNASTTSNPLTSGIMRSNTMRSSISR
jgi:hypothetical protein